MMTDDEKRLLLTTARVLRAQLFERAMAVRPFPGKVETQDLADLNVALAPFETVGGEPINQTKS
jgi:hypothetical protein